MMRKLAALLVLVFAGACRTPPTDFAHIQPIGHDGGALPNEPAALLKEADRCAEEGPAGPDLPRSLAAAEALLQLEPKNQQASWRAARAVWLMGLDAETAEAEALSERCLYYASLSHGADAPVDGDFYSALCMGFRARLFHSEGLALIKEIIRLAESALTKDAKAHHAGGHRVLGGVYLYAPAWPTSVGDPEEAIYQLELAVKNAPAWPENHYLLAAAYLEEGDERQAVTAFQAAEALMGSGKFQSYAQYWKPQVDKLKAKLADHQ